MKIQVNQIKLYLKIKLQEKKNPGGGKFGENENLPKLNIFDNGDIYSFKCNNL